MGRRGKVVFARIADEKKRKESLRKRKAGLLKKMSELTILCGMEAAVVVCNREDNEPTVWPSKEEAKATINKFLDRSEVERKSRSHNTKSLFAQKCKRLKNKAEGLKERNDRRILQAQITSIYDGKIRIEDLDAEQRKKLSDFADKRKEELQKHVKRLKRKEQQGANQAQAGSSFLQMPREAASGRNGDGLAVRRESAPARFQLTNDRGMTQLAPSHSLRPQTPHQFGMTRYKVVAPVIGDRNFPSPAEGHRLEMNLGAMKQTATIPLALQTPNPHVMVPNYLTGDRLNRSGVYGQTNIGGVMQHNLSSSSFMLPTAPFANPIQVPNPDQAPPMVSEWPSVYQPATGININNLTGGEIVSSPAATPQGQLMNDQGNGLNMTETFYGGVMQHNLPSPSFMRPAAPVAYPIQAQYPDQAPPLVPQWPSVHQPASGLNINDLADGLINGSGLNSTNDGFNNASTRTLTGDGHFNEIIQLASPPSLPLELPRRLGLPTVPPVQHDASGRDMPSNENSGNTTGSRESGTAFLDESRFDAEYWNAIEFPEHAISCLNLSNISNGTNNEM
ncbi:uncharacterized protein LOC141684939 [Apium graveolens]|uniref:uncharacterized protein LOC141684939 n=1 Tax=Apium graveolens TaxID=4045 RepID=UPI003D7B45A0